MGLLRPALLASFFCVSTSCLSAYVRWISVARKVIEVSLSTQLRDIRTYTEGPVKVRPADKYLLQPRRSIESGIILAKVPMIPESRWHLKWGIILWGITAINFLACEWKRTESSHHMRYAEVQTTSRVQSSYGEVDGQGEPETPETLAMPYSN